MHTYGCKGPLLSARFKVRGLTIRIASLLGRVDGHVIWNRKEKGRFPEVAFPPHPTSSPSTHTSMGMVCTFPGPPIQLEDGPFF